MKGDKGTYIFTPCEELIPRDLTQECGEYFDAFARRLEEVVNFASQVLTWQCQSYDNEEFLNVPLMLLREAMDLTDSCSILIQKGTADTTKILARSLFEIFLYIEYIFKADLKRRCYAYMLSSVLDFIKYHESILNEFSGQKGARRQSLDENRRNDILSLIADKKTIFEVPGYDDAYSYYETETANRKAKGVRKKLDAWYSYYDGPANLRDLSRELGIEHVYQLFYSKYSKLAHGNEAIVGKMVSAGENKAEMYQLRSFVDVKEVGLYVFLFSTSITKNYVRTLYPEKMEDLNVFDKWCKMSIKTFQ